MADQETTVAETPQRTVRERALTWLSDNRDSQGSKDWLDVVSLYNQEASKEGRESFETTMLPVKNPMDEMGFFASMRESITGTARETEYTRMLPSYTNMPELSAMANIMPSIGIAAATASGTPEEMAKIIQAQYPQVKVEQDEKGNYLLTSAMDGQRYVIKPGFESGDIGRFATTTAMYTPAAAVTAAALAVPAVASAPVWVPAAIGAGALMITEAAYQKLQEGMGGDFNWGDVVLSGVLPEGLNRLGGAIKNTWRLATSRFRPPQAIGARPNLSQDEVNELAKKAIAGDKEAQQALADLSIPDPEIIAAAERLGIGEYLQPDHVSTDRQFIELMQLVKSWKGGSARAQEIENLVKLGDTALDQVNKLGAEDVSTLNSRLYSNMDATIKSLKMEEDKLWDGLRALVPENYTYNPQALIDELTQKLANRNGNPKQLSKLELEFLKQFSPNNIVINGKTVVKADTPDLVPTFAMFDNFRRDIGAGLNKQGQWKDEATGALEDLYGKLLGEEQKLFIDFDDYALKAQQSTESASQLFELARNVTRLKKGVQDDMDSLFDAKIANFMGGRLTGAMSNLTKGNAELFKQFVEAVPEDERTNVIVSGMAAMFGNQTKMGNLNFNTYSKWYRSLQAQPEAYNTLKKYLPEQTLRVFEDLYRVSAGVNRAIQENVSRTGASLQLRDLLATETIYGNLMEMAKQVGKRAPAEFVTSQVGLPGAGIAGAIIMSMGKETKSEAQQRAVEAAQSLITSPAFMNMVKDGYSEESVRRFSLSAGWNRFARAVNFEGDANAVNTFIRSIYTSATSAVETGQFTMPEEAPEEIAPPPQARVQPRAPQTRGHLIKPDAGASAQPQVAAVPPAPGPTAQGPAPSSREMLQDLFPFDTTLRAG